MPALLAPCEAVDGRLANACSMSREWMMRSCQLEEHCLTTLAAYSHTKMSRSRL